MHRNHGSSRSLHILGALAEIVPLERMGSFDFSGASHAKALFGPAVRFQFTHDGATTLTFK